MQANFRKCTIFHISKITNHYILTEFNSFRGNTETILNINQILDVNTPLLLRLFT